MKIRYSQLRKIVVEEMKNLGILPLTEEELKSVETVKAKEIDPGDEADTLEKEVDHVKALKIKEAKLLKALGETRSQIRKTAAKNSK
jgi:hypothetical protein